MTVLSTQEGHFRDALLNLANALAVIEGGGDIAAPRLQLISDVKVKIDEMMPEGEGSQFSVIDDENNTDILDLYINSRLDPAAKTLMQIVPVHLVDGANSNKSPVPNADTITGYVILDSDFLRLIAFKMVGWERDVTVLFKPGEPGYNKQYTVLRGGKVKPACNLTQKVINNTTTKVIEYFSLASTDTHTIEKFIYVAEVAAEDVQANLWDALGWICASEILQITGRQDESKLALERTQMCFKNL